MKILITGASGFIGGAVAQKMLKLGHTIYGLSRSPASDSKLRAAGIIPLPGDFNDPKSLTAPASQVDAIISTASIGQQEGTPENFAKDRDAVAVMIKALGDTGKPFIFTSGSAIFGVFSKGEASTTTFAENTPVPLPPAVFAPPSAEVPPPFIDGFGGSMAPRAETEIEVIKAKGIRGIVIRPGLVYGEGKGYDLPNLIKLAKEHRTAPYLGVGDVRQGYVHIDDLVDLFVLAFEKAPAGSVLHAVTDEVAMKDLAKSVSRLVGAEGRTEAWSLIDMYTKAGGAGISLAVNKRLASEKTKETLGWHPVRTDILSDVERGSYAR